MESRHAPTMTSSRRRSGAAVRRSAALRRPETTLELADQVGRHANTTRVQLQRLADAGRIECRTEPQARSDAAHAAILPRHPGGAAPEAHADLSRWLACGLREGHALSDVQAAGREIGRGLARSAP
jgi:hypothetical protein